MVSRHGMESPNIMINNMHEPISTAQIGIHGGLAVFGALTHALRVHRDGKAKTLHGHQEYLHSCRHFLALCLPL